MPQSYLNHRGGPPDDLHPPPPAVRDGPIGRGDGGGFLVRAKLLGERGLAGIGDGRRVEKWPAVRTLHAPFFRPKRCPDPTINAKRLIFQGMTPESERRSRTPEPSLEKSALWHFWRIGSSDGSTIVFIMSKPSRFRGSQ